MRRELQGAQAFAEATAAAVEVAAVREAAVWEAAVREGEAAAAAPPSPSTHPGAASSSPRLPKLRDAGTATTPSGLAPLARLANDAPVVHVVEGPGGVPLEVRVHLPNGFPGQMPSGFDSRPPPTTPAPSPPGLGGQPGVHLRIISYHPW